ncbi:MAG TPA: PspA/IM30 family protein [Burkholderiales bacterium]|nr:PspA/IM30 family protein [Burkholderiales bacterium]
MGILSRLTRLLTGKANSVMDRLEGGNIEVVTEQTLRDYNVKIKEVRAAIGNFEAEINLMQKRRNDNDTEIARLNELADAAIAAGKDSLAADYESSIMELESTNQIYQEQINANNPKLEELTKAYSRLLDNRNKAQLKVKEISAKQKIFNAREAVEDSLGSAPGSIASELQEIGEATDRKLLSQEAQDRLDNGPNGQARLDFEKEQKVGNINDRLAARRSRVQNPST